MTALAGIDELESVMRRDLCDGDIDRIEFLLDVASDQVRTYTGRKFTAETAKTRLRVRNGKVRLPQAPVSAVSRVQDTNGNDITFEWFAGQVVDVCLSPLNTFEIEGWRGGLKWVDVTYSYGYTHIPSDVMGVVCNLVAAALDAPPEAAGEQQETLGPYTDISRGSGTSGVELTQTMKDQLFNYTSPVGSAFAS